VDFHLQLAQALVDPKASFGSKLKPFVRSGLFSAGWYLRLWIGRGFLPGYAEFGDLAPHMRFLERSSRKLARVLLYAILRYGPKLERRQLVLFRIVDIGAELFAMAASCVRARMLVCRKQDGAGAGRLADHFCRLSRRRVQGLFRAVFCNDDKGSYEIARQVLEGEHTWLESGIVNPQGKEREAPKPVPEQVPLSS